MPEDRSLDEFAGGDANGSEESPDDEGRALDAGEGERSDGADTDDSAPDDSAPDAEPATPTATWTTDGAACDRCGESVARRWFDDGALVCAACKEW